MEQFEKVCKGLEVHIKPNSRCVGCPYPNNGLCGDQLYSDALSLIRQQQERIKELEEAHAARVMSLEEAIEAVSKKGGFVWIEQKSHPLCDAHVSPSNSIYDCPQRKFKDYGKRFIPKKNSFRFMWRCWTSWPTDEQRKAVPWNG